MYSEIPIFATDDLHKYYMALGDVDAALDMLRAMRVNGSPDAWDIEEMKQTVLSRELASEQRDQMDRHWNERNGLKWTPVVRVERLNPQEYEYVLKSGVARSTCKESAEEGITALMIRGNRFVLRDILANG